MDVQDAEQRTHSDIRAFLHSPITDAVQFVFVSEDFRAGVAAADPQIPDFGTNGIKTCILERQFLRYLLENRTIFIGTGILLFPALSFHIE